MNIQNFCQQLLTDFVYLGRYGVLGSEANQPRSGGSGKQKFGEAEFLVGARGICSPLNITL